MAIQLANFSPEQALQVRVHPHDDLGKRTISSCFQCFHNHNYQEGTSKFINKALILDNKQLLSNMIDHEATQVPYTTRTAFLTDYI